MPLRLSRLEMDVSFLSSRVKKRVSLFKPTSEDEERFKGSVEKFLLESRKSGAQEWKVPITWERLSSGYRIISLELERIEEILGELKVRKDPIVVIMQM